jgi:hypothetical protein
MEIIVSIYYFLIGIVIVFSFISILIHIDRKTNIIFIGFCCLFIFLIQAFRSSSVGVDVSGYLLGYNILNTMDIWNGEQYQNYEIGFSVFSQFLYFLGCSEQAYLAVIAAFIIIPIGYICYKYSKNSFLSLFIYITLGFFTFSFSGLRQIMATAITFFSFKYVTQKKYIKFFICILIAMSFHKSAVIFLFAYPLYYLEIKPIYYLGIIPLFIGVFLYKETFFLFFHQLYYEGTVTSFDITQAYTMLIVMIIVLILSNIFKNNQVSNFHHVYENYLLVAIFIQIFASISNTIMRIGYYYYLFIILLIPEIIMCQKDLRIRILAVLLVFISLIYFFQMTTGNGYLNVNPYLFFWEE